MNGRECRCTSDQMALGCTRLQTLQTSESKPVTVLRLHRHLPDNDNGEIGRSQPYPYHYPYPEPNPASKSHSCPSLTWAVSKKPRCRCRLPVMIPARHWVNDWQTPRYLTTGGGVERRSRTEGSGGRRQRLVVSLRGCSGGRMASEASEKCH